MLEHRAQLRAGECEQREGVVEAQGADDVVLTDAAGGLDDVSVAVEDLLVGDAHGLRAAGGDDHLADVVADATAVLDGHEDGRVGLAGLCEIGVGGKVAEVGLLLTHLGPQAGEIDVRDAEDVAFGAGDLRADQVGDGLDLGVDQALGPEVGHALRVGRVGAGDGGVVAVGDDVPVGVELDDEVAHVLVGAVGVDHQRVGPAGVPDHDGIDALRHVAVAQAVRLVHEAGVGAAGDDDVHVDEAGGEFLFDGDLLHVREQDHLVHGRVGGQQRVDLGLDDRRERVQLFGRRRAVEVGRHHAQKPGAGDDVDGRRGRADDADQFAASLQNHRRGDGPGKRRAAAGDLQRREARLGGEVKVGRQVGEQRPLERRHAAEVVLEEDAAESAVDQVGDEGRTEVELVVAEGDGVPAELVLDDHVGDAGLAEQRRRGLEEQPGQDRVAGGEPQGRVLTEVRRLQRRHHRRGPRRVEHRRRRRLLIRHVKKLEGEGLGRGHDEVESVDRDRAADLVGHRKLGQAAPALARRDDGDGLGAKVAQQQVRFAG